MPRVTRVDLETIFGSIMRHYAAFEKATPEVPSPPFTVLDTPISVLGTLRPVLDTRLTSVVHNESGVEGVRHTNGGVGHTQVTKVANASVSVTMKNFEQLQQREGSLLSTYWSESTLSL